MKRLRDGNVELSRLFVVMMFTVYVKLILNNYRKQRDKS